jgi:hypothetical protein
MKIELIEKFNPSWKDLYNDLWIPDFVGMTSRRAGMMNRGRVIKNTKY